MWYNSYKQYYIKDSVIKSVIILLLALNLYAQNQEENMNTHNQNNYSYQTTSPENVAVYLMFYSLFNSDKLFDSDFKNKKKELRKEFEYLDLIDKNTKNITK